MDANEQKVLELTREWEEDFDKYPLPICFDPHEERREMYRRTLVIENDVREFLAKDNT
jgi:hypothetical protein